MPGYILLEEKYLQPRATNGVAPNPERLGFLDYMRELRQEQFPFNASRRIMVVGLEEVLLAAVDHLQEVEAMVHATLSQRATDLEAKSVPNVQVVFRCKLAKANDFWFEGGLDRHVSLRGIFPNARFVEDQYKNQYYHVGWNLT